MSVDPWSAPDLGALMMPRPTPVATEAAPPDSAEQRDARLFRTLVDVSEVRRRYDFFLWTQMQLQALLPHGLLICGLPRPQSARMVFDHYYGVPYEPASITALCDPVEGLINTMVDRWIGEGFEPLSIYPGAAHDGEARISERLAELGFGDAIVHGIPKAQSTASAHGVFAFVSLAHAPGDAERRIVQVIVPQLFGAYCRSLTRDRPQATASVATSAQENTEAPITEREAEILRWIRDGKSNVEIGMILSISPLTVKNHVQKILRKLNASNRAQAVSKAISMNLLTASAMRRTPTLDEERGFTLLEVLVVLVIIGLLAGIVAPKFFAQVGKSETRVARAQIDALSKALDQYRLDNGHYPNTAQGLAALTQKPEDEAHWAGPYLSKALPNDPWGKPYLYKSPAAAGDFELQTLGKDGRPGGEGDAQDVTVQQ